MIPKDMRYNLTMVAGVSEDMYESTQNGIKFTFENSLRCNQCQIIPYHDNVIMEFRKITNNVLQGKQNILVSEKIIPKDNIQQHFEEVTGIYLSFMGL